MTIRVHKKIWRMLKSHFQPRFWVSGPAIKVQLRFVSLELMGRLHLRCHVDHEVDKSDSKSPLMDKVQIPAHQTGQEWRGNPIAATSNDSKGLVERPWIILAASKVL
jgi:hypothetical protein